jgi:succinate dehydrogenase/fumarate reductase flavoprotein subunit
MENYRSSIGRRDILKRALLATGAVAVGGTVDSPAAQAAEPQPAKWDDEADVVVVGYGFAGTTVAITAYDAGAKVLMLEKAPEQEKGGNSRISGNIVFWPNDVEKAKAYFRALLGPYTDNISDQMIEVWATEMHGNRAWLEKLGMKAAVFPLVEFPELPGSDCVQCLMNGEGPPGEARLFDGIIEPAMKARQIRTLYETSAVSLVKAGDEVVGAIADQKGKRIAIKANRGVVLTCGGFENNAAMVRTYINALPHIYPSGTPYNTGDGIRMAVEAGAELWHMNNIAGPEFFFKAPDIPVSRWTNIPGRNYIWIAKDGTRFVAEGVICLVSDRHGKVNFHGEWMQQPAPTPIHMIFDETFRKSGPIGKGWNLSWDYFHGNHYNWSDDNSREIENGWIKRAATVRELAAMINVSPDALDATVSRFNTFAQNRKDEDFGREFGSLGALQTPPFYAIELTPSFVNTQGGPRRNERAQVIGRDGAPIPRLYSAGELGSIYAFLYQGGGNVGECFAFGRIAGNNVAQENHHQG